MTVRDGSDPRDRSGAHRLTGVEIDDEHYARPPSETPSGRRRGRDEPRAGGRPPMAPRGRSGFGFGGLVRLVLFLAVLAGLVLVVSLTVLRPVVAGAVVGWAADNPSALRLPFVADLVREDLGTVLTEPTSSDAADVEFTVLDGDTASAIGQRLTDQGLLRDPRAFVFITTERALTGQLEAGTFVLRKNMTPDQMVTALLVAKSQAVAVGIREGLRLEQVTAKLQTLPLKMDVKAFYDLVKHPPQSLLKDYPWLDLPKGASLEGYLAPATYRVLPDSTPEDLVRQMLDTFYTSVGPERLNVPKARGLSFHEVLTLASLVEREAKLDEERALIAGVYEDRLNPKIWPTRLLQSDPTIIYINDSVQLAKTPFAKWQEYVFWTPPNGALQGVTLPAGLTSYDTYSVPGLMPGPIASPSIASIDAALAPDTKKGYLYFLAKNDGSDSTAFARTFKEHQANIKKYGK